MFFNLDVENRVYFYFTKRYSLRKGSPVLQTADLQHQASVLDQKLQKLQKLLFDADLKLKRACGEHNTGNKGDCVFFQATEPQRRKCKHLHQQLHTSRRQSRCLQQLSSAIEEPDSPSQRHALSTSSSLSNTLCLRDFH